MGAGLQLSGGDRRDGLILARPAGDPHAPPPSAAWAACLACDAAIASASLCSATATSTPAGSRPFSISPAAIRAHYCRAPTWRSARSAAISASMRACAAAIRADRSRGTGSDSTDSVGPGGIAAGGTGSSGSAVVSASSRAFGLLDPCRQRPRISQLGRHPPRPRLVGPEQRVLGGVGRHVRCRGCRRDAGGLRLCRPSQPGRAALACNDAFAAIFTPPAPPSPTGPGPAPPPRSAPA